MHSPISKPPASATPQRSRTLTAACVTCALLLQACGATLPACQPASSELPSPPSQSTPQPAQPYSKTWQLQVDDWRNAVETSRAKLKGTQLMRD